MRGWDWTARAVIEERRPHDEALISAGTFSFFEAERADCPFCGRGGPGFPDEPLPELVVGGQPGREDLQGHKTAQAFVPGPEHHGHAARADPLLQPVPGDPRGRAEAG